MCFSTMSLIIHTQLFTTYLNNAFRTCMSEVGGNILVSNIVDRVVTID